MRNNVEKVLERDQKLNELDEKADALQDGASQFEKSAGKLKNKFWMENLKAIIAGSVVGLLVLGLIYWKFFMPQPPPPGYGPPPGGAAAGGEGSTTQTRSHKNTAERAGFLLCISQKLYTLHHTSKTRLKLH